MHGGGGELHRQRPTVRRGRVLDPRKRDASCEGVAILRDEIVDGAPVGAAALHPGGSAGACQPAPRRGGGMQCGNSGVQKNGTPVCPSRVRRHFVFVNYHSPGR